MSRESDREQGRDRYITSAIEVDPPKHDAFSSARYQLLGRKSRYEFVCQCCDDTAITTTGQYQVSDGSLARSMRWRLGSEIKYALARWAYKIPHVGRFLGQTLNQLDRTRYHMQDRDAARRSGMFKAFQQEVENQFHRCSECGHYVCDNCISGSLCLTCSEQAQKKSDDAQSAQPEVSTEAPVTTKAPAEPTAASSVPDQESHEDKPTTSDHPDAETDGKLGEWQNKSSWGGRTDWSKYKK